MKISGLLAQQELVDLRKRTEEGLVKVNGQTPAGILDSAGEEHAFSRFEDVTKRVIPVPNAELDAKRREDQEP